MNYKFKLKPFEHQLEAFELSKDMEAFALLMEQGTGKSKVIIDTAAYQFGIGGIDAFFIVTLNGVHLNWILNEIPIHMPDHVEYRSAAWSATMRKADAERFESLWDRDFNGLRILTMNIEALSHSGKRAENVARQFLSGYKTLFEVDESQGMKRPGANCTKALLRLARYSEMRRISTGTPIDKGPLDFYTQFRFLHRDILGFDNFYSYRSRYAEIEKKLNHATGKEYPLVKGFRNLEELSSKIAPYSYRKLKTECLDLPPKLYEKHYVELGKKQAKYYADMRKHLLVELEEGEVTAQIALTKMLRLQQILGGFMETEEFKKVVEIEDNKRIEALLQLLEAADGKILVFARFKAEIKAIEKNINYIYGEGTCLPIYGDIDRTDRMEYVAKFQDPDDSCRVIVANQQTGGTGLTLHAASTVIYYSNDFSLIKRMQSEDRAHRIGTKKAVTYIDIEARGTMDTYIINAMRQKKELARLIMNDPVSTWI